VQPSADPRQAFPLLALAGRYDACGGTATVEEMAGGQAVFEVRQAGELVAAFALGVQDCADGRLLRCGAAGALPGHDVLPLIVDTAEAEARRVGAVATLCETARPGMVRRLKARGYRVAGFILRKDV
jgi:hypothetical protein